MRVCVFCVWTNASAKLIRVCQNAIVFALWPRCNDFMYVGQTTMMPTGPLFLGDKSSTNTKQATMAERGIPEIASFTATVRPRRPLQRRDAMACHVQEVKTRRTAKTLAHSFLAGTHTQLFLLDP